MTRTERTCLLGVAVLAIVGIAACGDDDTPADRQAEVAERGADVMPFDLEATTHHFEPATDGLVETVVADDPDDEEQIRLIREHLASEAERFTDGDYGDPADIHGDDMPGLSELEAGAADVTIVYDDIDAGGRITFTSGQPDLVDALHRWGEAQTTDHGAHADPA